MIKQKMYDAKNDRWIDMDLSDGLDAYVMPATTPADAGKVMGFDENGAAIPVDQQSGGGMPYDMLVTVTFGYGDDGDVYTIDKSYAEISEAMLQGKKIMAILVSYGIYVKTIPIFETDYGFEFKDSSLSPMSDGRISVSSTNIRLTTNNTIETKDAHTTIGTITS